MYTRLLLALATWLTLLSLSLVACVYANIHVPTSLGNGLSLLANIIQILSTVVLYHLFMKVHILHKHVKHLAQNQTHTNKELQNNGNE